MERTVTRTPAVGPVVAVVIGLVLALVVGLVAAVGLGLGRAPAQAAPYPGTVEVAVGLTALGTIGADESRRLRVALETRGNAAPRGPLEITYVRRDGEVELRHERFYDGEPEVLEFEPLGRGGRYVVTVTFLARATSVYTSSGASTRQYVKGPR